MEALMGLKKCLLLKINICKFNNGKKEKVFQKQYKMELKKYSQTSVNYGLRWTM